MPNENKPGYKHTPLGWIPEEWEVKKLGELGKVMSGLTYSPDDINEEGILVLRSSNIKDRKLVFSDNVYVKVNSGDFNPVQKGDILICVRNGSRSLIGKNALITDDAVDKAFGAFMATYRSQYNSFLYQLFDTDLYLKEIHKNLGATINSINGSDLKLFKFPIPPVKERKKIAAILSTWDEAITKTQQLIAQLQQRNKGLMQQLLTGKKRLKGFEKTKWNKIRLGDVTKNFSRRNKDLVDAKIYSVTNTNGFVLQSEHFSREVAGEDLTNYKVIKKNEFAYNPARINVGSIAYFQNDIGVISSLYVCFSTTKDILDYYLELLLKLDYTKYKIHSHGEGGVRIYLWYDLFKKIKLEIPSIEEQKRIIEILKNATDEIKLYEQKLVALQQQKKGLMQKLLTGEIRVNIVN